MPFCGTVVRDLSRWGHTMEANKYDKIPSPVGAFRALNPKPIDPSREAACRASTTARAIMERLPPLPGKTDLSFWYIASGESGLRV